MLTVMACGRACKDPTIKPITHANGVSNLCELRLACYIDKDTTEFINVRAWAKSAELIYESVRKGDVITITGTLSLPYNEEKKTSYAPYITVDKFRFGNAPKTVSDEVLNNPDVPIPYDAVPVGSPEAVYSDEPVPPEILDQTPFF